MAPASTGGKPVIGITTYADRSQSGVWDVEAAFLPRVYFDAVNAAGGIAVLLPPQPADPETAATVVAHLDGLISAGGKDVESRRYGQEPHIENDEPKLDRDAWEFALLQAAIDADLPFLGICRGAQVLNVLRGGTLHQHLPDVIGTHRHLVGDGTFAKTSVDVAGGSLLSHALGDGSDVTVWGLCYHHQALDQLGEGLVVTARAADDGVIEAVELSGARFGVAVQTHPEQSAALDGDVRLFAALVEAARGA